MFKIAKPASRAHADLVSDALPAPIAPSTNGQALLTPDEAAQQLGIKATLLERWRGTGEGPRFVRLSRKSIRYRACDLDAYIASRVVSSTAQPG